MLCEDIRHLAFVQGDGKPMPCIPGQFIQIHFSHNSNEQRRSYSIASVPVVPGSGPVAGRK